MHEKTRTHFYTTLPYLLQKIGYVVFKIIYTFFVHIDIRGRENLGGLTGPVIIAANHTHELDATLTPLLFPFLSPLLPVYFVSSPTEKYKTFGWRSVCYGGTFFNMLGAYAVYSGYKNYAVALADHVTLLSQGHSLFIFPEGKRTKDGLLNPARGGLGYLVHTTGVSVVPVAINTFFNLSWRDFLLRRRTVVVTIGKPLLPHEIFKTHSDADTTDATPPLAPTVEIFQAASQHVLDTIGEMLG